MGKQYKIAIWVSALVSSIVTFPRLLRPSLNDIPAMMGHFFYLFLLCVIFGLMAQWIIKKNDKRIVYGVLFLIVSGIISVIYQMITQWFLQEFNPLITDMPLVEVLSKRQFNVLMFLRGVVFSIFIYLIMYYLHVLSDRQQALLEIESLKKEKLEAQLHSLKSQISPHFLFNSLSTLRTIVPDASSKKYVLQLSNVYRYLLGFKESNVTTLEEELEFIQSYLYILHERFEEALVVDMDIDQTLKSKLLPPLALQLLVENAIKHNVVSLDDPLSVQIKNEASLLVVTNNLQPKLTHEESTGKGLDNINKRYKLLANQQIEIYKTDQNFTVKIPLLTEQDLKL
ncbi:sensor histidine kinase [Mangrovimonas sp. ST2L15]|uniref:sensor histidine kinase n=1 Tax=Mangrovimonas sp. ST2L15 TaxID=1645916 RepID=UPI0006B51E8E|nr:histidine kinase [Mangrovimonas sp. ST2L15]